MKWIVIIPLMLFSTISLSAQTKIIFDMDIDTDCDDAGALAILHALADNGEVEILGTIVSTHYPYSAPCVEAINRYYGRPNIPIGAPKSNWTDTGSRGSKYAKNIAGEFKTTLKSNDDAPDAVKVYRQILAAQKTNSVVILSVGYLTNIRDLLESGPDEISPLSGVELVRQKVKFWVCNGAEYPNNYNTGAWGNFTPDPTSAAIAVRDWPGTIWFCGEGRKVFTGSLLHETPTNNPVRRIYDLYLGSTKNTRPSWDPISTLFAVRSNAVFWTSRSGDYHIFDNGTFEWRNSTNKNHHIVEYDTRLKNQLCRTLDRLMTQPPCLKSEGIEKISAAPNYRDIFPDTWVGDDALGRVVPDWQMVGLPKTNGRHDVGIFYVTWHKDKAYDIEAPYSYDVSKFLHKNPNVRFDKTGELFPFKTYHWGEPELGYFLSRDKFVIWRDLSMLADAGVDVIILDVTNGNTYWDAWNAIFEVMDEMDKLGNKVPKFCFWTFNKDVITVVQGIYEKLYKQGKHKKFWYYWDGKPLMLYRSKPFFDTKIKNKNPHYDPKAKTDKSNPHYGNPDYTQEYYTDYPQEIKNFFTLRNMWWGYYEWYNQRMIGTEDNWSFGYDMTNPKVSEMSPIEMVSKHNGKPEEAAVTPAQHATTKVGKCWTRENGEPELNQYDLPVKTYVPWLGKKVEHPEAYGIYYQQRWDEALQVEPPFIYLNDWNEWIAGKYRPANGGKTTKFLGRKSPYFFVDQYNEEFNRCIQPMKGGYTDNYYMQTVENIRKYKGVRKFPVINKFSKIKIDGDFKDWDNVKTEYRDTIGDTVHRDYNGYGGLHYTDKSGRNDIITCKVAVNATNVYFLVETHENLTPSTDKNWMLLLIDSDKNSKTGWHGYNYRVNHETGKRFTIIERYNQKSKKWWKYLKVPCRYSGNKLELSIPRSKLRLAKDNFTFDFHWADNPENLTNIIDFCTTGDNAPNRRFNYRCSFHEK
ncbi:MAG: hypothetical protein DRI44_07145 [Chlamydiae bacterium]|nr:MAG: hypothetical protein DRI44_07145 [Chlamydiota bacterium]